MLAGVLEGRPGVHRVWYPPRPSHPQHAIAARQLGGGGGMLAVELEGGAAAGRAFIDALRIPERTASLGSIHTIVVHPPSTTHRQLSPDQLAEAGIAPGLLRVSVGLEDAADLAADFERALGAARVAARGAADPAGGAGPDGRGRAGRRDWRATGDRLTRGNLPGRTDRPCAGVRCRAAGQPAGAGRPGDLRAADLRPVRRPPDRGDRAGRGGGDRPAPAPVDRLPQRRGLLAADGRDPRSPGPVARGRRGRLPGAPPALPRLQCLVVHPAAGAPRRIDRRLHAGPDPAPVAPVQARAGPPAGRLLRPCPARPRRDRDRPGRPTTCERPSGAPGSGSARPRLPMGRASCTATGTST